MDDEAFGINNGKLVIRVVTCMIMIRSYVPGFSKRCTSCCWCIRNLMAGSTRRIQWRSLMVCGRVIFTFCQISDFLLQCYAFSKFSLIFKWPKSQETSIGDFLQHRHVRVDFSCKKKPRKEKLFLDAKLRFCGNSHRYWKNQKKLLAIFRRILEKLQKTPQKSWENFWNFRTIS